MKRVLARLTGMTLILAGSAAAPASAANTLGLSLDGVRWSQSISDPLFDSSMRWVPADSTTATFYIRNQGGTTGDLAVDILGSQIGNLLDSGDLHITAKGGGGKWTTVSEGGEHRLLTAPYVPVGQVAAIKVNVALDPTSANLTQLRAATLNFRVTLAESLAGGPRSSAGSPNSGSELPGTGSPELRWYAAIGAMLIGAGLAFVTRRREEEG